MRSILPSTEQYGAQPYPQPSTLDPSRLNPQEHAAHHARHGARRLGGVSSHLEFTAGARAVGARGRRGRPLDPTTLTLDPGP